MPENLDQNLATEQLPQIQPGRIPLQRAAGWQEGHLPDEIRREGGLPDTPRTPAPAPRPRRRWRWLAGGIAGLLVVVGAYSLGRAQAGGNRPVVPAAPATAAAARATPAPVDPAPVTSAPLPVAAVPSVAPAPVAPVVEAPSGPATSMGDGTYQVGVDIAAGRYKTAGPDGSSVVPFCYWERASNDSGDFSSIIANDNIGGPGSVSVKKGEFLKLSGGCAWSKQ